MIEVDLFWIRLWGMVAGWGVLALFAYTEWPLNTERKVLGGLLALVLTFNPWLV